MKKNFKLMLVALLAFVGFNSAKAALPATIEDAVYQYTLIGASDDVNMTADVFISGVVDADAVVKSDYSLYLPGTFTYTQGSKTYTITVKYAQAAVIQNHPEATSVVIPKEFTQILPSTFDGCSSLATITFESGSQVTTIGANAFATTQITNFNFSPCTKLAELPNEVFVEHDKNNTFITEVTVPTSPLFKHINGAFKNLTSLTAINGLGSSYIQEVIAEAFSGCKELKTLNLPGNNLRYVDASALKGSNVENLSVNVNSLISLGGGTVGAAPAYAWADGAVTKNLYGESTIDKSPLKTLTLTGTLTGKICAYAFSYCNKFDGILDLSDMNFGSTGQIEANTFNTCYKAGGTGIKGVKIGNITDNISTTAYTIAGDAFKGCDFLASVEIGNITTANAIGAAAFNNKLKSVKIGQVKANGAAFEAGAFVWADVSGATLDLAQGTGEFLNANDVALVLIPTGTFNMAAIVNAGGSDAFVYPVIKIGEIRSKGGVFADDPITLPKNIKELTYTGAIAANGLNNKFATAAYTGITKITFKGAIGAAGIATGAFAKLTAITTLTFDGLLSENAVDEGAFGISDDHSSTYTLTYSCGTVPDYTVNPFNVKAMNAAAIDGDDNRFIALSVTNTDLLANYQDKVNGLNGSATDPTKFDIYFVEIATVAPDVANTFIVFRNENEKKMAWGRYDMGKFDKEKGPNGDYAATDMTINRYQKLSKTDTKPTMKLTLYGVYTDEDQIGEESTIYMVPLMVKNGQYKLTKSNDKLIIVKAEKLSGEFAEKDIPVAYDPTAHTETSYWSPMETLPQLKKANDTYTNQQLWDGTSSLANEIWKKLDGSTVADKDKADATVQKALYIMTDPAKYKGFRIDKNPIEKGGAYIKNGWWYALLHNFKPAAAARIVWLNDDEATGIFAVKNVNAVSVEDAAIYNLQGVRVSNPTKGVYIQNGKKIVIK